MKQKRQINNGHAGRILIPILLLAIGLMNGRAAAQDVTLTKWDGTSTKGTFVGPTQDGTKFIVNIDDRKKKLPISSLLEVNFDTPSDGRIPPSAITLKSGDRLRGEIRENQKKKGIRIRVADLNKAQQIDLMNISSLRFFMKKKKESHPESVENPKEDLLYKSDGDIYRGFLTSVKPNKIIFEDKNLGERELKPEDVHRIELTSLGKSIDPPDTTYVIVHGTTGSTFVGTPIEGTRTNLTLQSLLKDHTWSIPLQNISSIIIKNGRTTFLSDLKPENVVQERRFIWAGKDGKAQPLSPRYHWTRDHSVPRELGKEHPIKIHSRNFRKGISCVPYTRLTYRLDKQYKRFQATIGLDDRARHSQYEGSVVFRVYVDDKKVYDTGKTDYSDFPKKVDISVKDHNKLTLEVDVGEGYLDFADWGNARLIR